MYIEFLPGEKYPAKGADISDTPDHFHDAGYILEENDLVVDIDELHKEAIEKLITMFSIKTQIVWTQRGAHLYFKKPQGFRGSQKICHLGFKVEYKYKKARSNFITIKRDGVMRSIDNPGVREDLPVFFSNHGKKFEDLNGLDEGDGRNNKLFEHRIKLGNCQGWQAILRYVNNQVFALPLPEEEFQVILRDLKITAEKDNEYYVAEQIMQKYKVVSYGSHLYFYDGNEYSGDIPKMIRTIFNEIGAQKTRYVEEIVKQMEMRAKLIEDNQVFAIKFKNGILKDGQFIEIDYKEFTPYSVDIHYDPDAEPVQIVDDYVDLLTDGDEEYKKLLFEILAHTFVTNKEFKRMLGKFFIFVGDGGNGKGTLLAIIKEILNSKNCSALSIKNMSDERYLPSMQGKLANLGDDLDNGPINDEQMKQLKNISTCDFVSTRELFKQSRDVELTVSLIFTSNHILKSFEKGHSYKRRVMWLPMYGKPKVKDKHFISKITNEDALEYWVKLIIEGYHRLYKKGTFTECAKVQNFNDQYHEENNSVLSYLNDLAAEDLIGLRPPAAYDHFEAWALENGLNVSSMKMFKDAVNEKFGLGVGVKKISGKSARVFMHPTSTDQELEKNE